MDEILLEGMRFYGYHGVNPEEQTSGQRFVIDLSISADLTRPGQTDRLDDSINYSLVFKRVRSIVEERRFDLLEALGHTIATELLAAFSAAQSVTVTIRKPGVAIKGSILDSAGVRIRRDRNERAI